ncbi:hypothetical protein [Campylobacter sp.]|uniref:hypothetical protein n=1 Tax=Campylobacter sp. TaxID=205 RepID=UPI002AA83261|nr:hypothetical protein [Campylobacter sp.]
MAFYCRKPKGQHELEFLGILEFSPILALGILEFLGFKLSWLSLPGGAWLFTAAIPKDSANLEFPSLRAKRSNL